MNISEIKDLLAQFDASTLREFSYKNNGEELNLSKNQTSSAVSYTHLTLPTNSRV